MLRQRHHWRWKDVRREFVTPTGSWRPVTAGKIELKPIAAAGEQRRPAEQPEHEQIDRAEEHECRG